MKRGDFLKNALMAVAVSLLPKVLRPVEHLFEAGESPVSDVMFIPKYDPTKSYKTQMLGGVYWCNGAALNYFDKWEYDQLQKYQKYLNNKS